jgi:hypothetical protein
MLSWLVLFVVLLVMVFLVVFFVGTLLNFGRFFKVSFLSLLALNHVGNMGLNHSFEFAISVGLGTFL